jgi:hypothetical protein
VRQEPATPAEEAVVTDEVEAPSAEADQEPELVDAPEESVDTAAIDLSDMNKLANELSPHFTNSGVELIYQKMISEWSVDPEDVAQKAAPQDWKSVWDNGWAAAEDAENKPVETHTDHGLPVRDPGARLIPGGAAGVTPTRPRNGKPNEENGVTSSGGLHPSDDAGEREAPERDPDAIRSSISNHFGGVRAGRSHARNTTQGLDHE